MFDRDLDSEDMNQKAIIKVLGVGGGGCNAVDRMIENGVSGVDFVTVNTDAQALRHSNAERRLLIGKRETGGLGAGAKKERGRAAAIESEDEIREELSGTDMVFITAGMGGGTGSGAAPVIAKIAKEMKCLTVGVVTKPFTFEGKQRMEVAEEAIAELKEQVDTLIVIPNDRLMQIAGKKTSYLDSFRTADNVLRQAVQGITDIIRYRGVINLDFADVRTIMTNQGTALMGIGVAGGESRARDAAQAAIKSPLLETTINGATNAIVNITSSVEMTLYEVDEVIREIKASTATDLNVIYGCAINETFGDDIVVTVIATGFSGDPLKNIKATPIDNTPYITDDVRISEQYDTSRMSRRELKKLQKEQKKKEKLEFGKNSSDVQLPDWLNKR